LVRFPGHPRGRDQGTSTDRRRPGFALPSWRPRPRLLDRFDEMAPRLERV